MPDGTPPSNDGASFDLAALRQRALESLRKNLDLEDGEIPKKSLLPPPPPRKRMKRSHDRQQPRKPLQRANFLKKKQPLPRKANQQSSYSLARLVKEFERDQDFSWIQMPYESPLRSFRDLRLSPLFAEFCQGQGLKSATWTNSLDPLIAICPYSLDSAGLCWNPESCPYNHLFTEPGDEFERMARVSLHRDLVELGSAEDSFTVPFKSFAEMLSIARSHLINDDDFMTPVVSKAAFRLAQKLRSTSKPRPLLLSLAFLCRLEADEVEPSDDAPWDFTTASTHELILRLRIDPYDPGAWLEYIRHVHLLISSHALIECRYCCRWIHRIDWMALRGHFNAFVVCWSKQLCQRSPIADPANFTVSGQTFAGWPRIGRVLACASPWLLIAFPWTLASN